MKRLFFYTTFLLTAASAHAQLFPKLGAQRAGISALTFLKMDVSPRTEAMSGASISMKGDGYSLGVNPAGITDLENNTYAFSTRVMPASITNNFLSGVFTLRNNNYIGGTLTYLNAGNMEKRTVYQPDGTGEYVYAYNMALGASYAKVLSQYFSLGVSAKYIREQLAEFSANTVAVDLGFLYKTDYKDLRFAVVLQNFGLNSALKGNFTQGQLVPNTSQTDPQPLSGNFKLGMSFVPYKKGYDQLTMEAVLNHPNDNAENLSFGAEYTKDKILHLRLGYRVNVKDRDYPSAGVGYSTRVGRHPLRIDYAVSAGTYFGLMHTVGVNFSIQKVQ